MPSRPAVAAILLFWLATTGYAVYRDVWPRLFPSGPPPDAGLDFAEPPAPRRAGYGREQAELVAPLRALFASIREVSAVVSLECGAFG